MRRLAALLPLLALFLAGCDDKGNPTTDVDTIVFGAVIVALIAAAAFCVWCVTRR